MTNWDLNLSKNHIFSSSLDQSLSILDFIIHCKQPLKEKNHVNSCGVNSHENANVSRMKMVLHFACDWVVGKYNSTWMLSIIAIEWLKILMTPCTWLIEMWWTQFSTCLVLDQNHFALGASVPCQLPKLPKSGRKWKNLLTLMKCQLLNTGHNVISCKHS